MTEPVPPVAVSSPCPICRRPAAAGFRPFCGKRCADVDLGRWFTESYRVPARPDPESGDDEET